MNRLPLHLTLTIAVVSTLFGAGAASKAPPAAANQPPALPMLAGRFIAESEQRDPLFADSLGIHRYDAKLDDYSPRGALARFRWLRQWHNRIDASLHESHPSPGDDADAHALLDTIDLELFEDTTVKPRETDPTYYTGVIGQAVYALTGRHYAPAEQRFGFVAKRLAFLPRIVAAAEASLTRPPRTTTLQAIDENAGNLSMYASLTSDDSAASPATRRAIAAQLPAVLAALRDFDTYLRRTLLPRSNGNPRVGARIFDRELLLANGTDEPRAQLVAEAQADFDADRKKMLELAIPLDTQFYPTLSSDQSKPNAEDVVVRRVLDRLAIADHPSRTGIFRVAAADVAASERFLSSHPVVVLPQPSTLHVKATPDFMAGFAGASLDPAGPFQPLAGSYYYIDKIPKQWSASRVQSYLRDYNSYELRMLSIHEAVPGHYVQFRYNAQVPSLVRRALPNGSFAEGWAVYGEGMMLDAGYGNNDPRLRLFQLKWRLREEANTIIDAAFHTGDLNHARCRDFLQREAYQERSEAETKWHRLQLSHDQLTSYYVGLAAIRHAQVAERSRLGSAFDVGPFNAALLHMGSVEPRYIARLIAENEPAATPAPSPQGVSPSPTGSGRG